MPQEDGQDRVRFETPEDIALSFDLAGPGSRLAAAFLDYLVIAALVLACVAALAGGGLLALRFRDLFDPEALEALSGLAIAVLIAVVFGTNLLYFIASEWLLSGQSLGKRVLGLRVVAEGGYAVSVSASVVRNLMRVVDFLPGTYLVGIAAIVASKQRRRLGDLVAGTLVVREARGSAPRARFPGERYSTLVDRRFTLDREAVDALGPPGLELLDGYYDRVESLAPEAGRALTRSIAETLALRLRVPLDAGDEAQSSALLRETYLALRERLES